MKQKVIIGFSVLLLLAVVFLIAKDLFTPSTQTDENPTEYNIDKFRQIDPSKICYQEIRQFNTGMDESHGIAIDDSNYVYITGNKQVSIFSKKGAKTGGFPIDSSAHCLTVDNNNLYLGIGNQIEHYRTSGEKIKTWNAFNTKSYLTSIAVNGDFIYAADAENNLILKYNKAGELQLTIGKRDTAKGVEGFVIPSLYFEIAFGAFNDMWVVNPGRHRLENYSGNGELQSSWGTTSMDLEGFAGCCNPAHLAILPNGEFVTYEKGLDRIKIYSQTGKFVCVVAGPESLTGSSDLNCSLAAIVNDLATDKDGNIYVLDANNKVMVFERK
jgi:hypothetical protein